MATPIGNLGDLSPRASEALRQAEVWIVEDTRVSGKLATLLKIKRPMWVLNDHTGDDAVEKYAKSIAEGTRAALLTDGGSPAISDPGARLTDRLLDVGTWVSPIPGPSAVTAALAGSGFFAQRFVFLGFLARKPGEIREALAPFAESPLTIVLFESSHRIEELLESAHAVLGDRRVCVARELTKTFEQLCRFRLGTVPEASQLPRKGEFTLIIEGFRRKRTE